ncbi:hypothetical protein GCM10010495_65900 [Kitasatospora herbaricolor]|nr:hypothetical protein GCM10010495_65900 [Kitasatospora herbaricolor]
MGGIRRPPGPNGSPAGRRTAGPGHRRGERPARHPSASRSPGGRTPSPGPLPFTGHPPLRLLDRDRVTMGRMSVPPVFADTTSTTPYPGGTHPLTPWGDIR